MQTYLVGFAVIGPTGCSTSRIFMSLPIGEIVTQTIVERWEHEIRPDYSLITSVIIRVFTFQAL